MDQAPVHALKLRPSCHLRLLYTLPPFPPAAMLSCLTLPRFFSHRAGYQPENLVASVLWAPRT